MRDAWLEVCVELPDAAAEAVANILLELGSPGLCTEENGGRSRLLAYFDDEEPLPALRRYLEAAGLSGDCGVRTRWVAREDWAENWKQHFPPLEIGERLYVHPPWVHDVPAGRIAIEIDPGMAFGTGHHATTRGCLEMLERLRPRPCERALDLGTGSGILAIALARLGVSRIVAVDIDPLARAAAAENAARNGVAATLCIVASLDDVRSESFPLLLANLQCHLLLPLEPRLAALTEPGGLLIASGLLDRDLPEFFSGYARDWLESERHIDGEWVTVGMRRRS